jgi:hypothetical protein
LGSVPRVSKTLTIGNSIGPNKLKKKKEVKEEVLD